MLTNLLLKDSAGGLLAAHCTVLGPSGREMRKPSATAAARLAAPGVLHHQAVQEHSSCSPGHGRKQLHLQNSPNKTPCWDPAGLCLCLKSLSVCVPGARGRERVRCCCLCSDLGHICAVPTAVPSACWFYWCELR